MRITSDDINASVINESAFKSILREPIQYYGFSEITGDLRVAGALVYLHRWFG